MKMNDLIIKSDIYSGILCAKRVKKRLKKINRDLLKVALEEILHDAALSELFMWISEKFYEKINRGEAAQRSGGMNSWALVARKGE